MSFSPLPTTQIDDEDIVMRKTKVRQLSGRWTMDDEEESEEEEEVNEELVDYKKQLFEMEVEESGEKQLIELE